MAIPHTKEEIEKLVPGKYCFFCLHPNPRKIIGPMRIVFECLACGRVDGVQLKIDPHMKSAWVNNEIEHFTTGALLYNTATQKYLLMKKRTYPLVIDVIAGHILTTEQPEETLIREVKEETNLDVKASKLLWEGIQAEDLCRRGANHHYWYLYLVPFTGTAIPHMQEVAYFQEYTLSDVLREEMLNPPIKRMLAELNTSLLTP